ncbi:hypothetical protein CK203_014302 [Vitis vinifera]|uniref:Uncharacterized protein n=1 Tax=Vitis vinifera TaxID=29760 RepID=A0A438K4V1_VITVI|nr:hypothetical protein CK203_014302 [Vitis vinifera]
MVDIVISVAAKVAECLVDPITSTGLSLNYRRNITDLNQQIEISDLKGRLQIPVE